MATDTAFQNLSFGALEDYIGVGEPVYLQWFGNTSPVSLTLCLSVTLGHPTVSVIDTDITGGSYTWTPNNSLSNGDYSLELWQKNGDFAFSHDVTLVDGRTNSGASTFSEASTSATATATTASSTQFSATGSSSFSSALASEHIFSSAPVAATATLPSNTAPIPVISPPSPDAQNVPVLQHTISNGSIAGIVVGIVVFILLTTTSSILCWRRQHRSSQNAVSELPSHQIDAEIKSNPSATIWIPELDREGAVCGPHELAGTPTSLGPLGATEPCLTERGVLEIASTE